MHNVVEILSDCFESLQQSEQVEKVEVIPSSCEIRPYVEKWKVITEIEVSSCAKELELYFGFSDSFPYELPDIYYFDPQFDYFPHIGLNNRQLCYVEDGCFHHADDPTRVIEECLRNAKCLLTDGVNKRNTDDFRNEIISYWWHQYKDDSNAVDGTWLIYDSKPKKSGLWEYVMYRKPNENVKKVIVSEAEGDEFVEKIGGTNVLLRSKALYLESVRVSIEPPYCMTFEKLVKDITDEDLRLLKSSVNQIRNLVVLFPLFDSAYLGGVLIPWEGKMKGFRKTTSQYEFYSTALKTKRLNRIYVKELTPSRIMNRTNGTVMRPFRLMIGGLGSVGSNLCQFLQTLVNVDFVLIDTDSLAPENIGRHLLGERYLYQSKADAMKNYLMSLRPRIKVEAESCNLHWILENKISRLNDCDALFFCSGDVMVDQHLLKVVQEQKIHTPIFILWLEPFAIAGHMVYINPELSPVSYELNDVDGLYVRNLITKNEYKRRGTTDFIGRDAGCNATYSYYSGSDVQLFLSAMYPYIYKNLMQKCESKSYRWIGNINIASKKGIELTCPNVQSGMVEEVRL